MSADDIHPLDQAFYDLVHDYRHPRTGKRGAIGLAQAMGVNASSLQHEANRTVTERRPSAVKLVVAMHAAGDYRSLDVMNSLCGRISLPIPPYGDDTDDNDIAAMLVNIGKEAGDVFREVTEASADSVITQAEAARVSKEIEDTIGALAELQRRIRQKAFPLSEVTAPAEAQE